MTLKQLQRFAREVEKLPTDLRRAFELAFHNPTDAPRWVAEAFNNAGRIEDYHALVEAAEAYGIEHAGIVAAALVAFCHGEDRAPRFVRADGTTTCCNAFSTFVEGVECCKVCYGEVMSGDPGKEYSINAT
jgi:hypothetical protein